MHGDSWSCNIGAKSWSCHSIYLVRGWQENCGGHLLELELHLGGGFLYAHEDGHRRFAFDLQVLFNRSLEDQELWQEKELLPTEYRNQMIME